MMQDLVLLIPEAVAILVLLILLVREIMAGEKAARYEGRTAFWGCFAVLGTLICSASKTGSAFNGTFLADSFSFFFKGFFILSAAALIPMSRSFFQKRGVSFGEFILIFWASLIGLFFLVSAQDLLLIFITFEIFTLSLYVLAASLKKEMPSIESGIKYLVLGSLASAFVIYGIALVFIASGSTSLPVIRDFFMANPNEPLMMLGILLILGGLGFKISSAPFQLWVPDVYQGAPTPVTAYLAVVSKAAGFAVLIRLLFTTFTPFEELSRSIFAVLAVLTLVYGNLGALGQTNLKRLMGFSGISHAGYLMIGLAVGKETGLQAILYYLLTYAVSTLGAFWVISLVGTASGNDRIDSYKGLTKRSPFLAAVFLIALLSLAGIPPLAGFFGKFLILSAAIQADLIWLALLGIAGALISIYYYFNIIKTMYFEDPETLTPLQVSVSSKIVISILAVAILLIGFWQAPFWALAGNASNF